MFLSFYFLNNFPSCYGLFLDIRSFLILYLGQIIYWIYFLLIFYVAWEVLQTLVIEGWRSKRHKWACGLEIQAWGFFTHRVWAKTMMRNRHVMDGDDSAR